MRTIRIKLYKFQELSEEAQKAAIEADAKRTEIMFAGKLKGYLTQPQLDSSKEWLIKRKSEFTESGKLFEQ